LWQTRLNDLDVVVSRTGWSGELGYQIYLRDSGRGAELWDRVMSAGAAHGIAAISPNTIRSIEGALLSYGSDITREDNPYVLGLDWMVDLNQQDDFIGRPALERISVEGPQRKLAGIELQGPALAGKSTLIRHFVDSLPEDCAVAVVDGNGLNTPGLLLAILGQFGFVLDSGSTNELMGLLRVFTIPAAVWERRSKREDQNAAQDQSNDPDISGERKGGT